MKQNDLRSVEVVHDLCRYSTGYQVLVMYLLVAGYSQAEVAQMLGISRQALNDEMILIREQYRTGEKLTFREAKARRRNRHDL